MLHILYVYTKIITILHCSQGYNIAEETLSASESDDECSTLQDPCDVNTEKTTSPVNINVTLGEEDMDLSDSDVEGP